MAGRNVFFNNFKSGVEQGLLESLIIEQINVFGQEMYYIPRKINNLDEMLTADDQSSFEKAFLLPVYIESYDSFQGDGSFLSKFGGEIRDQVTFTIASKTFNQEVAAYTAQVRPNEGDLIYYPLNQKCFQIKFVDKFEMHYPLGRLYVWKFRCELFEYSDEVFSTGIYDIDRIQKIESTNQFDYVLKDEAGNFLTDEDGNYIVMEQYNLTTITGEGSNEVFDEEAATFVDWNASDPWASGSV